MSSKVNNSSNYAEKKQRSLAEFIIVVVIVFIMMKFLIDMFFQQQEQITDTAFEGVTQTFISKINVVHGQWFMDDQPSTVKISSMNSVVKEYIYVNAKGWIDSKDNNFPCQDIWQQTLSMPLQVVKSPVIAIEIINEFEQKGRICRYSIANGQSFDYRSDTGKVYRAK